MKEKRYDTIGGLTAPILIYETIEEAEGVVPGGLLEQANNNMAYRGILPAVREIICNLVEEETSITRESKVVGKTKAGKDIVQWEADGKYINRTLAQLGKEDFAHLQEKVDEACRNFKDDDNSTPEALSVDLKGTEKKAGGGVKLAAKYKTTAAMSIALGTVDKVNEAQLAKIGKSFTPTNDMSKVFKGSGERVTGRNDDGTPKKETVNFEVSDKDAETYGWLIKEYFAWKELQEQF